MTGRSFDVVVIGGGAVGLAVGWRCRTRGLAVAVVDPAPGAGATGAAAGMLAPVTEVHYGEDHLLELCLESARMYPGFVEELETASGRSTGYRRSGTLLVARDADDNAALGELYAFQQELGLDVRRLRGRECLELEPGLAPSVRGGIFVAGDHQIDNRALHAALVAACERSGVEVMRRRAVGVVVEGGACRGVALDRDDTLGAEVTVLAAGCWSGSLHGLPQELVPPVRPVKGQLLHLRTPPGIPPLAERNVRGLEVYVVPRADGRVVVGATVEEKGFDTTVTAGAVLDLLRGAFELLPGVTELELTETVAGLRPGSPDNAPLLGPSGIEGLLIATGHYRNGILLTPITAEGIAEAIVARKVPAVLEPFDPVRFTARAVGHD